MKKIVTPLLSLLFSLNVVSQSRIISGHVYDENKSPLSYVNVYIDGTLDGTSTNDAGKFELETDATGVVTLVMSFVGYDTYSITKDVAELQNLKVTLKPSSKTLQDVVIVAGNYSLKSSALESQNAIDLVTTAGSDGDLYKSLTMLPGVQAPGTDGRLVVRGGTSRESQTFIDGMHVLSPYTASSPNSSSRSKYSPFHFEGINFSTGGYSPEYSQSLSSILPLETKNTNPSSKYGVGLMNVSAEAGGTKSWDKGSVSLTANYTDMALYNATLFPGENDLWDIPYRQLSIQNQIRLNFDKNTTLKTYYAFDKTRFRRFWEEPFEMNSRNMDYSENNLYLNTTFRKKFANNINYFAGAAFSWNNQSIDNSRLSGDVFKADDKEIHLKTKAGKRFTNLYKLEIGAEAYLKKYDMQYNFVDNIHRKVDNNISGAFVSNDFNLTNKLLLNVSGRVEYSSLNNETTFLPRIALNYHTNGLNISAIVGKYQQMANKDYLVYNDQLFMENNVQTMLSLYYHQNKRIYRAEFYNKKYNNLPLIENGIYTSKGYGYSRGIDLYLDDRGLIKNIEYTLAYSYNDSKRKYLDFPEEAVPDFVTRHNASLTLKYTNWKLRSIFGITNRLASGRHYHDPNKDGFMNATTPLYHTLDVSVTVLAHKKVIVYAGASNVFNRKNVFGYTHSQTPDSNGRFAAVPTTMYQNQSLYIGVFITLGKNVAYEGSYF